MNKPDLIPSRGAISEQLTVEVKRELTADDLLRLADAPKVTVPVLQKLRATHHRQAQLLAQGKTPSEVAVIVGCTVQRLVQLQIDPTFAELIAYYQDQVMVASMEDGQRLQGKIVEVGEMAVDEMMERLDSDAKRQAMPIGEIRKIAEFAMDRTVAPPKSAPNASVTPTHITMNFGTALRNTAGETKVIEGEAEGEAVE